MTRVIKPTAGCHYFPPGLQLHPQPLRGLLPISLLGVNSLPKTVTRQRRGCGLNPVPSAPESRQRGYTLTTRLQSHTAVGGIKRYRNPSCLSVPAWTVGTLAACSWSSAGDVRAADPSADGHGSAASQTAIGGGEHIVSPPPGR